jgi:hypothetical protein
MSKILIAKLGAKWSFMPSNEIVNRQPNGITERMHHAPRINEQLIRLGHSIQAYFAEQIEISIFFSASIHMRARPSFGSFSKNATWLLLL